ncbi:MAG: DNA methylase [Solobacterium sp.]|nr:DNA methylase [Solobacterium sp.]MCH4222128.1 DNA methylase [Solobacterium sp.]MCH4265885.1 DNA methylase [Solobacterium sp.]
MSDHTYIAIDLKSFYASVECVERGLDPLKTNLVVADASRTEKTICLAVSPSLKAYGIPGRPRLFEVVQQVKKLNWQRENNAPRHLFTAASFDSDELKKHPEYSLTYLTAVPRMAYYMQYSSRVYEIYLKYIAPEDIHVYSIDEVFMDVTAYLNTYHLSAHDLAMKMIQDVLKTTGITATAGISTNLYLCKAAMDIVAKHIPADKDGVRIAEVDEMSYRRLLWDHRPLTDFWRVGRGYAKKLEANGLYTMGDIARCSLGTVTDHYNEDFLYHLFGVNAELLIDHAWGWEPCTIKEIKAYQPSSHSLGSGQVLHCPYSFEKGKLILKEMTDSLALDLVDKKLVTDQLALDIGYDIENLNENYHGETAADRYGRVIPKSAHGTVNLKPAVSSSRVLVKEMLKLYERISDPTLTIRKISISANHTIDQAKADTAETHEQISLFDEPLSVSRQEAHSRKELEKERSAQQAILKIKKKFGKNAVMKGTDLEEGATAIDRNKQIGGHKA